MKPVVISISPNTEKDDILLSLRVLLSPWKWFDEKAVSDFENKFASYFGKNYKALAVNSGRSAEFLILKAMDIRKGDFVAIQALTCIAVSNPILWNDALPLYVDVDDSYNMDVGDLEKKLNGDVRCVIVQHSFGVPAKVEEIARVAKKHNISVIEDCAVSMGGKYNGKKLGTFGDISFFSFGRDKVISSVFGGMILTSNQNYYKKLRLLRDNLAEPPKSWVIRQLLHPILFSFIKPSYFLGFRKYSIGKMLLFVSQKLRILDKAVYEKEKRGKKPELFPSKMPGALAVLALHQFNKLDKFNKRRIGFHNSYLKMLEGTNFRCPSGVEGAIWLRVPIHELKSKEIIEFAKRQNILLGDWYNKVVTPALDLEVIGYRKGSCPAAEMYAGCLLNLPTYPLMENSDVENVVSVLKLWESTK
ncbi:MAG: hypothetical protein UT39_C0003G0050 [Candidatus Woesebacteria bacterium GW2011_GWA1_39_21]|uniref:DegT/DnrJ/EryC1/StrS aminotransferase n=1 Tax=Candidatus Woesebacteria bacterium GW2011_GWA1_39_21 TaxID=1618550 RepID=A0A0G0NG46_9BACT|nr:MAG: hypothetical protein UT39_C0003G0050 [Candidatus Woesebacteria bacterium GW2011_GWA1_39_21]